MTGGAAVGTPSEEAWPCSKRGTGAGRCAGLTPVEKSLMVPAWRGNMDAVETAIVEHDGFAWQNFHCIDGSSDGVACRSSTPSKGGECSAFLRKSCQSGSLVQTSAVQYKIGYAFNADHSNISLTGFEMDLGVFLASRGNYSWLGYGWLGCGCGWEYDGKMLYDIYHRPAALDLDYGEPTELCHETAANSGVFVRQWTKSTIRVDCNAGTSDITMTL